MPDLNQINARFNKIQSGDIGWINRITAANNKLLGAEYLKAYHAVDAEIAALFRRYGDLSIAEMAKYDRMVRLNREIFGHLSVLNPKVRMIVYTDVSQEFQEAYYRTGYGFESSTEATMGFAQLDPATIQASLAKQYDFKTIVPILQKNKQTVFTNVNHTINQGLLQGWGYGKMAKEIKGNFNRGYNDAVRITRTEGHRAREIGRLSGLEHASKKGVKIRRYWISAFQPGTRDLHAGMDGQNANKKNIFILPGGISTEAPGITGVAYWDINCLCHVGSRVVGFSPEYKRIRGKGIIKRDTAYKEWKRIKKIKTK